MSVSHYPDASQLPDLLLSILRYDDTDEREVPLLFGLVVLHADELEVELKIHAIAQQGLQHYCPSVIILLQTTEEKERCECPDTITEISRTT